MEVAKSLDVLDRIIGEFDDGSSACGGSETEAADSWKTSRKGSGKGHSALNQKIDKNFAGLTEANDTDVRPAGLARSDNPAGPAKHGISEAGAVVAAKQYLGYLGRRERQRSPPSHQHR